jgi:hypothetical protein
MGNSEESRYSQEFIDEVIRMVQERKNKYKYFPGENNANDKPMIMGHKVKSAENPNAMTANTSPKIAVQDAMIGNNQNVMPLNGNTMTSLRGNRTIREDEMPELSAHAPVNPGMQRGASSRAPVNNNQRAAGNDAMIGNRQNVIPENATTKTQKSFTEPVNEQLSIPGKNKSNFTSQLFDRAQYLNDGPYISTDYSDNRRKNYEPELEPKFKDRMSGMARRTAYDTSASLAKGLFVEAPKSVVGLADMLTLGRAGKGYDKIIDAAGGMKFKETGEYFDALLSPETRLAKEKVKNAKGFWGTAGTAMKNPSSILSTVAEETPSIYGGGAIGKTFMKKIGKPVMDMGITAARRKARNMTANAIGDAVVSTVKLAEETRAGRDDKILPYNEEKWLVANGLTDVLLSRMSGHLTKQLLPRATKKNAGKFEKNVIDGAISQTMKSTNDQMTKNILNGRPIDEGVNETAGKEFLPGIAKKVVFR